MGTSTFPLLDTENTSGTYSGDFGRIRITNGHIKGCNQALVGKENGIGVISLLLM
ncbi:MAG: hypothetical protein QFX35_02820 [Candidatus Verstraetearchaeota archaeon]|nr:hypothetical protein [Candidatus Verstraetearchaeota archaeon]